ncbi:pilus assembly protein CpaD [Neorhizobium sp. R1-B]|uniref:CpaD family pilus assembly protein n=1 Tax=Neorhizobium sp. R1-B TaxID=2485162 RepID=UPI001066F46A|nr:CpaD family pilus assembly protein [Neorhizobium sp. R1-B]TDX77769.1 pilus assembly protein CpaD [Neorhizobium sp. R1-B]
MKGAVKFPRHKIAAAVMLAASAVLLAGCGNSQLTTGSIPDDYRTRHPIVLAEGEHALDIPVASGDVRLSIGMKDTVKGFAQNFASSPAGVVQIQVPHGSYNSAAAQRLAGDIRRTLTTSGIRPDRILMSSYGASPSGDAAPIRLSYVTTKAMTSPCGEWPADLSDNTFGNRNWYNFGCASQNNLAAQIANPTDLIAPRGTTPIDATQRAKVISDYRGERSSN